MYFKTYSTRFQIICRVQESAIIRTPDKIYRNVTNSEILMLFV